MAKRDHQPGKLVPVTLGKLTNGWHADGGNLYLFVRDSSRAWVFRYTAPDGTRKNMGLGSLENIPLAKARLEAANLRAQVKDPLNPTDPQAQRKQSKLSVRLERAKRMTFKQCAETYIESQRPGWKNPKHAAQWESTLTTYVYPIIGDLPVADVDTPLVIKCLEPIWITKNETASRIRGRIESVLDWARTSSFRAGENPARWKGHLDNLLAAPRKVQNVKHHPALPFKDIGQFMKELRARDGVGAKALEFTILTAARSGEVRGATWDEVDIIEGIWTIPASRMKASKEHRVPLSADAIKLLENIPRVEDCPFIFPSSKPKTPMSDMTLTAVLRRMGKEGLTVHGFRSTFRDWAAESTAYSREVAEMALAHVIGNAVEAAYRRGDLFEKRRRMMADWSNYCARIQTTTGNVVTIKGAA